MTVEEDIQLLIQIVKKDIEIHEKRKFLETAPAKVKELDSRISSMDEELSKDENDLKALESERRILTSKIEDQNALITEKKLKLNTEKFKSNKEFKAMIREIEFLVEQVDGEEETVIGILDRIAEKNEEIAAVKQRIENEKDSLIAEKTGLEEKIKAFSRGVLLLQDEKMRILPHLSERVRRMHDRISAAKGDSGVANLVGDICQGCYSRVPPQKAHEIRRNDSILTCEVCGRILVYFPVD